jgi:hypothetical protein
VELCGALKNIIAIAAGAVDRLGFGDNGKAGLITRGLAEMTRLGIAAGANPFTFAGLAGIGDVMATCSSPLSRNHRLGYELAKGRRWSDIEGTLPGVAEGAYTVDAALAMAALAGVSTFVAAGDTGSTTCQKGVSGTSMSYPAVSPYVTAVGGTRLALGAENARAGETVWNDTPYGPRAAGGGGVSKLVARPAYQDGLHDEVKRAVPDISALADIVPGWPVVLDGTLQPVGGTSGATPLVAGAMALVSASERQAGRPSVGLANPWLYGPAARGAFFDVVTGSNDLAGVGCCTAGPGCDTASGLGVPDWETLPATLPPPA